jgi:hypothetical protein
MERITTYISIAGSPYANKVLTNQELDMILWEDDIQGTAPGNSCKTTQEDINKEINQLSGKTIKEYCEWRWPDNPEEQFLLVLNDLAHIEPMRGEIYAVYNFRKDSIIKNLSFKQAQTIVNSADTFIIPMDALNKE